MIEVLGITLFFAVMILAGFIFAGDEKISLGDLCNRTCEVNSYEFLSYTFGTNASCNCLKRISAGYEIIEIIPLNRE
jgi:hypothetical protein